MDRGKNLGASDDIRGGSTDRISSQGGERAVQAFSRFGERSNRRNKRTLQLRARSQEDDHKDNVVIMLVPRLGDARATANCVQGEIHIIP
jgi:hypothetical protein